ncbi:MAG: PASTA domain-containing protein [Chitinophagaceae bacterium]|nr:PASTA domain-containing protein [Chitinophagaceae bacterium]
MFKFITHRPLWLNILTGLLLAFAIFFIFIFSLKWLTHHDESRTVPAVTGKTFEEAMAILDKAGFDVEIQDSLYVDTVKPHRVLKQVPEPDEIVKVNRTVYITINRAVPPLVPMPNLVGFSFRSAEMELKNMGFRIGDTTYKADFAKNSVLEQRLNGEIINSGTMVRMGSTISFVLGSGVGNEKFVVPNLVGMRFCDAKFLVESHGLMLGSVVPQSDVTDTCNAFIYKQNPERFNEEKKFQHIRTGQTMDVFLQVEKPVTDSTAVPLPDNN